MRGYKKSYPELMYRYFVTYKDTGGVPSFEKFALSCGLSLDKIESYRKIKRFDKAYRICREIRRDYLIDSALTRRLDPTFTKFLLTCEFGMGSEDTEDEALEVRVTVEGGDEEPQGGARKHKTPKKSPSAKSEASASEEATAAESIRGADKQVPSDGKRGQDDESAHDDFSAHIFPPSDAGVGATEHAGTKTPRGDGGKFAEGIDET